MGNGRLIVICGIDGSGKTTLQHGLAEYFKSIGKEVVITRQPSDFYRQHPDIRKYLNTGVSDLSVNTIAMIAATDRMMHIEKVIIPSIKAGKIVICDRYVYSTYAYFKARNADEEFVRTLNQYVQEPDAGIFLSIDSRDAVKRVLDRDGDKRKFEERDVNYLDQVQVYLKDTLPNCFKTLESINGISTVLDESISYLEKINVCK
jgi:dTMP kinase